MSFDEIYISSEQKQEVEVWASMVALGYDAPSANANTLASYKVNHFGDSESILPFEPSRISAKIVSDEPWFYGGLNVDGESGIPVAAGEVAEIRGAADISAAITVKGEYLPQNDFIKSANGESPYSAFQMPDGIYYINQNNKLMRFNGVNSTQIAPALNSDTYITTACRVNDFTVAYYVLYSKYFYELNTITGAVKSIRLDDNQESSGYTVKINRITHDGEKYIMITNGKDKPNGFTETICAITTYNGVFTHKFKYGSGNYTWRQIWAFDVDKFVLEVSGGFALMNLNDLPDERDTDFEAARKVAPIAGGLNDYAQSTIYGDKMLIQGHGSSGKKAVLIDLFNGVGKSLGEAGASAISEVGILLFKGDEILVSEDDGVSWVSQPNPLGMYTGRDFVYYSTGKYLAVSSRGKGYFITEKRRVNVKQTFRVLKAYS
jgi:hypothetical protein